MMRPLLPGAASRRGDEAACRLDTALIKESR